MDGSQAFRFLGTDAFTEKAGQLHYQVQDGQAFVYGDVNAMGQQATGALIVKYNPHRSV